MRFHRMENRALRFQRMDELSNSVNWGLLVFQFQTCYIYELTLIKYLNIEEDVTMRTAPLSFLMILLVISVGCGGGGGGGTPAAPDPNPNPTPQNADWAVMLYMGGDNNLAAAALADLQELEMVGSTDQVHFTALADIFYIPQDLYEESPSFLLDDSGELVTPMMQIMANPQTGVQSHLTDPEAVLYDNVGFNSADPQHLTNFIKWSAQRFPAQNYALVIWNHGSSWLPGRASSAAVSDDYEGDGESMYIHEIEWAIKQSGIHFNLLDFTACNMASVEVAYQFKDVTDYICASQKIMLAGNDGVYETVASYLVSNPAASPEALGKVFVNAYIDSYTNLDEYSVTQSLIKTNQLQAVAGAVNQIVPYLTDPSIFTSEELNGTFDEPIRFLQDVDLGYYSSVLSYHSQSPGLTSCLENLRSAINTAVVYGRSFTCSQTNPTWTFGNREFGNGEDLNVDGTTGLNIFLPGYSDWIESNFGYYSSIGFCQDTGWRWVIQHAYDGIPPLITAPGKWWAGLAWSTNVDLDLWIFEPIDNDWEMFAPASPWLGTRGVNGTLSMDSFWTGMSFEYYQTFPEIIWGPYFFIADYYMDCFFSNSAYCQLAIGAHPNDDDPLTSYTYYIDANSPVDPDFGSGVVYFGFALYNPDDGYWYFFEGDRGGDSTESSDAGNIHQLQPDHPSSEEHQIRRPDGNFDPELIESYHAQGMQLADEMAQYQKEK